MPPSFKLQSVLDYRKLRCDEAQMRLADVCRREQEVQAEIDALRQEINKLYAELETLQREGITPEELVLYENRCRYQEEVMALLEIKLDQIRDEIEKRREALCKADQDKKVLEKLKEKQLEGQFQEERRKESEESDETAIRYHGR